MRSLPITPLRGQGLPDQFGRMARDLRVSVTDRCNLRCTYCMPAEGLPWLPKPEMLTDEELLRVVGVFVGLGVRQVRLTGGEPLLRRSLIAVVQGIAGMTPRPQIAMTTNGIGLDRLAAAAGRGRTRPGQRQPRHGRPRRLHVADPARPLRRRRARAQGGRVGRPDPGQGQRGRDARGQRPHRRRRAAVVPRPRLRPALHRADAAGRPARVGARADGHRRRDARAGCPSGTP